MNLESQVQDLSYPSVRLVGGVHASRLILRRTFPDCDSFRPNSLIVPVEYIFDPSQALHLNHHIPAKAYWGHHLGTKWQDIPSIHTGFCAADRPTLCRAQGYSTTNADRALESWAACFVTIPGVGALQHDGRNIGDKATWLQTLTTTSMPHAASFCFEHNLVADDSFTWKNLFNEGGELLDALLQLRDYEELNSRPIILSAHGLGGIIVKRAVNLAHQQPSRFGDLVANITGVMFFGTPHSRSDNLQFWYNAATILKYNLKLKGKDAITLDNANMLAEACRSFETAFDRIPVLSVYETQPTRVSRHVKSKEVLIVGKNRCKTNVRQEDLIGIDVDHPRICNMRSDYSGVSAVASFIDRTLEAAKEQKRGFYERYSNSPSLFSSSPNSSLSTRSNTFRGAGCESIVGNPGNLVFFADAPGDREDPRLPCHLMPLARNKGFFGRKEILEDLEIVLSPSKLDSCSPFKQASLKSFAICGPGGIGKTQIAAEFIHSRKTHYDAILWVQADEYAKLAQGFYHIAINLGLVIENSVDARDHVITREAVKSWLKNPVKSFKYGASQEPELATWILVFDNLDDLNILHDFWPSDSTGSVLITSHDPLALSHLADKGTNLKAFNPDEATDFLLKLTHREEEVEERSSGTVVAKRLGGLPLALTQMAGVISRRDLSFSEFLQVYDEESSHKDLFNLHFSYASDRSGYQHTLASVWALETLNESTTLLDILSMLDSDGIQERIIEGHRGNKSLSIPGYPRTNAAYQIARTELQTRSLITRDRGTQRITMHRMIQDAARAKMSADRFDTVFGMAVTLLSSVWPYENFDWRHGVSSRTDCEDLFPHVIRLRKLAERRKSPTSVSLADLEFPRLLTDAGWFSHERGNSPESQPFLTLAQQDCESLQQFVLHNPSQETRKGLQQHLNFLLGEIHYNSGCIATETNKPAAALSHFEAFHSMMLKQFGPDSSDTRLAISWNELGNGLMMNKRWIEAINCFIKSIETLKRQPHFTETSLSFPLVNLGFAYWIRGELDRAEKVCQQALLARRAAYGMDDADSFITGKLLHAFGNVRAAQGKMEESFDLHKRALLQYKKFTVGKNHHRTADVCIKVADHYVRLKQYDNASTLFNQALKIYGDREFYAPERARAKFKKSKLLAILGHENDADVCLREAMALYRQIRSGETGGTGVLDDVDFDNMITFWSR